uniref:Variant surface glycoprotein 1125.1539 n=1 Tax=Trypanosoma brucei TaxID=5691 RepID=A0A1J0R772_9TRYP|nr:variant surface glycoprotein 1125.1539 [Trypanosoma brucei]
MRATYTAWKTTVLLAMLQHVTTREAKATGLGAAATAANTLCDEIRYLMALANRLEAKTKGSAAFTETEGKLEKAHRLLAQMKVGKTTAAGHTVLATISEARAHQARSSIAAAEKVIGPAVKALRARAAMALAARNKHMKTITTTEQATHNGADPNPSSSSTSCTALHTPTLAETDNCSIESDANTQVKESNIDLTKIAKLKLAPDAILGVQKISLVARAKGTLSNINGRSSSPGWCAQSNGGKTGADVLGAEAAPQAPRITLTAEQMFDDPTAQTTCKEQNLNAAWATTTK